MSPEPLSTIQTALIPTISSQRDPIQLCWKEIVRSSYSNRRCWLVNPPRARGQLTPYDPRTHRGPHRRPTFCNAESGEVRPHKTALTTIHQAPISPPPWNSGATITFPSSLSPSWFSSHITVLPQRVDVDCRCEESHFPVSVPAWAEGMADFGCCGTNSA